MPVYGNHTRHSGPRRPALGYRRAVQSRRGRLSLLLVPVLLITVAPLGFPTAGTAAAAPPVVRAPAAPQPAAGGDVQASARLGFVPTWHPDGRHRPARAWPAAWPRPAVFAPTGAGRLSGTRVLLDPGHNIGNFGHTRQIAPGSWPHLRKGCNTTGTATNAGFSEARYAFRVVRVLRNKLRAHGATVIVTRDRDSRTSWGPCVQARGELGRQVRADLLLSVHADGAPASGHGFHVIAPAYAKGWTDDIARPSGRLARKVVKGMVARGLARSTYLSSTIQVRSDQETLRNSDVPAVIVETLNMRNAGDARLASSKSGRARIAAGLYAGIRRYLA